MPRRVIDQERYTMETETQPRTRPVRVTIVGTARPVGHAATMLHVEYAGSATLVDSSSPDVVVEDMSPEYRWTDGDAIVTTAGSVYARIAGKWHHVTAHGVSTAYDEDVDRLVSEGAEVLRCQALA